jgi:micrococcal nuclease
MFRRSIIALLLTLLALTACYAQPVTPPDPQTEPLPGQPRPSLERGQFAQVVAVVDGDTIHVRYGGQTYRLRYIGIDTPELEHDGTPADWLGMEAKAKNEMLVAGKNVFLEKDVSETDRYGRLLRYVWVGDTMINGELVRQGYAQAVSFPPDVKYLQWLRQLQQEAEEKGIGLWAPHP